jgi:hypothetical protein
MQRFTKTDLAQGVERLNEQLEEAGALIRYEVGGRNGYQATDEYPVDAAGKRIGTHVNRMVGSGTSRETYQETQTACLQHLLRLSRKAS